MAVFRVSYLAAEIFINTLLKSKEYNKIIKYRREEVSRYYIFCLILGSKMAKKWQKSAIWPILWASLYEFYKGLNLEILHTLFVCVILSISAPHS